MRIIFISLMQGAPWGGSEELWFRTAKYALAQKHEVTVCVYDWLQEPEAIGLLRNAGALIVKIKRPNPDSIVKRILIKFSKIRSFSKLKKLNPDVICLSQGGTYDVGYNSDLQSLLFKYQKPYVLISQYNVEYGGIVPENLREKIVQVFNNAANIFFVADRNKIVAERQLATILKNASVIGNPVNIKKAGIRAFPSSVKELKIACVARFECRYKGQDILLEALATERWSNRDFSLEFFGSGPDQNYLENLVTHFQLSDKVKVIGKTNDIDKVWEEHHLLVLPSLSEGTPLSMVEAMLCGRAVLATDVGGISDYIIHGKTGYLAPVASVSALSTVLEEMWLQKDNLKVLGINAYNHAIEITDLNPEQTLLNKLTSLAAHE